MPTLSVSLESRQVVTIQAGPIREDGDRSLTQDPLREIRKNAQPRGPGPARTRLIPSYSTANPDEFGWVPPRTIAKWCGSTSATMWDVRSDSTRHSLPK